MNNESEPLKVFYDTQTGQLIATRGSIGVSVYKITDNPISLGESLIKHAESKTGNLAFCLLVESPDESETDELPFKNQPADPGKNNTTIRSGSL